MIPYFFNDLDAIKSEMSEESIAALDTLIQVSRVTSGEEYDMIVSILKLNNIEVFDLSLYSSSNEEFITKLDDGKFIVKLPISEKLQGKDLMVYYVDEDGNIEEYEVTLSEDGKYAIFETDHFSMYTLAEVGSTSPTTGDSLLFYLSMLLVGMLSFCIVRKSYNN